jgi:hypothetical protein
MVRKALRKHDTRMASVGMIAKQHGFFDLDGLRRRTEWFGELPSATFQGQPLSRRARKCRLCIARRMEPD